MEVKKLLQKPRMFSFEEFSRCWESENPEEKANLLAVEDASLVQTIYNGLSFLVSINSLRVTRTTIAADEPQQTGFSPTKPVIIVYQYTLDENLDYPTLRKALSCFAICQRKLQSQSLYVDAGPRSISLRNELGGKNICKGEISFRVKKSKSDEFLEAMKEIVPCFASGPKIILHSKHYNDLFRRTWALFSRTTFMPTGEEQLSHLLSAWSVVLENKLLRAYAYQSSRSRRTNKVPTKRYEVRLEKEKAPEDVEAVLLEELTDEYRQQRWLLPPPVLLPTTIMIEGKGQIRDVSCSSNRTSLSGRSTCL
eukprot:TRINITY_DN3732_c0_g2_i1.p1 TRINITY_DN3732_c0_g2~~TRINITY_DN3732_c0_g2_i1.p1  ORF type:complete len:309 (-),score=57.13 TRINITY_DN3732_c0_g2_i1:39-965(-)